MCTKAINLTKVGLQIALICLVLMLMGLSAWAQTTDVGFFEDYIIKTDSTFYGYQSLVDRDYTSGELAYDYSVNIIKTGEDTGMRHRAFTGGRWKSIYGDGDHILQFTTPDGQPGSWSMWSQAPEYWLGWEEGKTNKWFSGNTMDAEVLIGDDSPWLMYVQVEIDPGQPIDIPGKYAAVQADRIMLLTSNNCKDWTRWEERGVIVNVQYPETTFFHHHEVIYVPWDPDGKCYWMYVFVTINGVNQGHFRIRSSDYRTFDYNQREQVTGMAEIGNQIGYLREAPGGPIFVRITFTDNGSGRTVPALQFSRNGLNWSPVTVKLEGSNDNYRNKNCYFLGLATNNGRGDLEYLGNNKWRALYAATTCNTPVAPEIYYSEIGFGTVTIDLSQFREDAVIAINKNGASSTELKLMGRADNYASFISETATPLQKTNQNWEFATGDYNNDNKPDLYCISKQNASGYTELSILNGDGDYQSWLKKDLVLPLPNTDANWEFLAGDYNGDGKVDLFCINKQGPNNKTVVSVLSGANNYQSYLIQNVATALHDTDSNWAFAIGDYNGDNKADIFCIPRATPGGYVEVHIMSGADNYQSWLLHVATPLTNVDANWEFDVADYNMDNKPDLFIIKKQGASNKTEVHALGGADNYGTWILHAASALQVTDNNWTFVVNK